MSWLKVRGIEIRRQISVLSLGFIHISWWGRDTIAREARFNREPKWQRPAGRLAQSAADFYPC